MNGEAPWYATAFDADYPLMQTYEEVWTPAQATSVELLLNLPPRARILDLGCGYGRHSRLWRQIGHRPVGLDLSRPLLERAREESPGGRWVRGDVRALPFRAQTFDAAAFMFVTFGYFPRREEDLAALREARRVLRPGGGVYLEIKHPAFLRAHLPPDAEFPLGDAIIAESSHIATAPGGERYEILREMRRPGEPPRRYRYSVRLYGPGEIAALLEEAGFGGVRLSGDYSGAPASPRGPRLIATGRRPGPRP